MPPTAAPAGRKYPSIPGARSEVGPITSVTPPAAAPAGRQFPSEPGRRAEVGPHASGTPPAAAAGRRFPSEPGRGAPAVAGRPAVYCEIDRLAVEVDPLDLSTSGLFVASPSPPPVDSELDVFLSIGSLRIEATGHVVQSVSQDAARKERRRAGYGLLFTQLDDGARTRLREAIESLATAAASTPAPSAPATPAPAAEAGPAARTAVDPKDAEVLAKLRAELASVEQQPPWTVLGISQGSDAATAREAFFTASKRYHPHVYARYALPEIKEVVTQLFIAYKRAFTSMTKTGRSPRTATRAVKSGTPPGRSSDPGNR